MVDVHEVWEDASYIFIAMVGGCCCCGWALHACMRLRLVMNGRAAGARLPAEGRQTRPNHMRPSLAPMRLLLIAAQEACLGGELFDVVIERKHFSEADAASITAAVLSVIQHCHAKGIIHRGAPRWGGVARRHMRDGWHPSAAAPLLVLLLLVQAPPPPPHCICRPGQPAIAPSTHYPAHPSHHTPRILAALPPPTDLKPENFLLLRPDELSADNLRAIDFGLSKFVGRGEMCRA